MAIKTATLTRLSLGGRVSAVRIMANRAKFTGIGPVGIVIMEQMQIMAEKRAHLHRALIRLFIL